MPINPTCVQSRSENTAADAAANSPKTAGDRANSEKVQAASKRTAPSQVVDLTGQTRATHAAALTAATALLRLENDLRQIRSIAEFGYFVTNETRLVTRSQQTFLLLKEGESVAKVVAVSALSIVDRSTSLVTWIEAVIAKISTENEIHIAREFNSSSFQLAKGVTLPGYPLRFLVWVPFINLRGKVIGGIVQARSKPWTEADLVVSRHIASACTYTLNALRSEGPRWTPFGRPSRRTIVCAAASMCVLAFYPVSMSALAPVEVSPAKPFLVTAPVEGVVHSVLVEPNALVKKDQPLVRMADTVLRSRLEVSEREVLVAEAKVKKAGQLAFTEARGRHELGVALAEAELRYSERDYARELLERSTIKAERDGVAFYTEPKDLIGRPVAVGERLMDIADPNKMEFRIDLPVADAIVLRDGARVKIFLDSDPLRPIEARLVRADFQARPRENQQLAFRLIAEKDPSDDRPIRLGVRGTAQIYSDKVSLAFYLFRRPISVARQSFGI